MSQTLDKISAKAQQLKDVREKVLDAGYSSDASVEEFQSAGWLKVKAEYLSFTANETALLVSSLEMLVAQNRMLKDALAVSHYRDLDWDMMGGRASLSKLQDWRGRCFDALTAAEAAEDEWMEKQK